MCAFIYLIMLIWLHIHMFINMYTINLYDSNLIIGRYRTQGIMTIGSIFQVPQSIIVGPVVWLQCSYSSVWWLPAMENLWTKTGEASNGLSALDIAELHPSMLISLVNTCFSCFSIAVIKTPWPKASERKEFVSVSISRQQYLSEKSGQTLKARTDSEAMEKHYLQVCSACHAQTVFLQDLGPPAQDWHHSSWAGSTHAIH